MKTTMIELISDDELIDLLVDTAHEASVPSESNFLASVRGELKARLTPAPADGFAKGQQASLFPASLEPAEER